VPIVLKSGILSLLENSGPVQACNGIALPLSDMVSSLPLFENYFTLKIIRFWSQGNAAIRCFTAYKERKITAVVCPGKLCQLWHIQ